MCRFSKDLSLFELLNIQDLVSVDNACDQKAFLMSYAKALMPAMLMGDRHDEIKEAAALIGAPTASPLSHQIPSHHIALHRIASR